MNGEKEDAYVRPFFRVVANGVVATRVDSGQVRVKCVLVATPEPADKDSGFLLSEWPRKMAELLSQGGKFSDDATQAKPARHKIGLRLEVHAAAAIATLPPIEADVVGHRAAGGLNAWRKVRDLWCESITGAMRLFPDDPWTLLLDDIRQSLTADKHEAKPHPTYQGGTNIPESTGRFDNDGAIVARRPAVNDKISVQGMVSIRQGEMALDEERVRASRVLAKIAKGPYLPGDGDHMDGEPCPRPETPQAIAATVLPSEDDFNKKRRQKLFDRLSKAIEHTNDDRARTTKTYADVSALIGSPTPLGAEQLQALRHRPASLSPLSPANEVLTGDNEDREKRRASQTYGAWLQRSTEGKGQTGYKAQPSANLSADAATAFEHVRAVYYSLQGDALLSRLFCFAVDVEFVLPDAITHSRQPAYMFLSVEAASDKSFTPPILTAAKFDNRTKQFWPVSRFEMNLDPTQCPSGAPLDVCQATAGTIEQHDGVWNLGAGYGSSETESLGPRYDLVSLDVRRAVDSTPSAIDRGKRHLTAGFTVLDNGRAEQMARDMAIAAVQGSAIKREPAANVVLYAEELTIGRRLDVAAVGAGAKMGDAQWRGLMSRYVSFKELKKAEETLKRLVPQRVAGPAFFDESAFQTVARAMPLVNENSDPNAATRTQPDANEKAYPIRRVEAIAEEAIVTWDGTPLAALTSQGTLDKSDIVALLPFKRAYDLPSSKTGHANLLPPPLRYGVAYMFSMRSVFLGGGSPSIEDAAAVNVAAKGQFILPPAKIVGSGAVHATGRVFRRHESIDAPQMLMPKHVAMADLKAMAYEAPYQAILRSISSVKAVPAQECSESGSSNPVGGGPRYIEPKDRAFPETTMRVFVPPAAALDTVVRHGKLDRVSYPLETKRGGLRDIEYDGSRGGFPLAMTLRAPAFSDTAIYGRKLAFAGKHSSSEDKGAAVFIPGGANPTKSGETGYLPDPAAEQMILRLRIRGADRYLEGCWITSVYDAERKAIYPHALPLVVAIEPLGRRRPQAAKNVSEVLMGDPDTICRMSREGKISQNASGAGVKVRHVMLCLAEGEEYDLEVVCAPKRDMLARRFSLPETMALQLSQAASHPAPLQKLCGPAAAAALVAPFKGAPDGQSVCFGGHVAKCETSIDNAARLLLDTIENNWPIEEVAGVARLRVAHAINAPLDAPVLEISSVGRPKLSDPPARQNPQELRNAVDAPGATIALLKGTLNLNLEEADAFEIVASVVAATGKAFDDPARSRSLLARRSGRWPKLTVEDGKRHFAAKRDVVGFDVDSDGRVTLPREIVTLMRVDNLPHPDGIASDGSPFGPTNGRLTQIDLGRLHANAILGVDLTVPIATAATAAPPSPCPNGAELKRTIKVSQPNKLADTRARKLLIHAVALSRFAHDFETAPRYVDGKERLLHRRQPLKSEHQTLSGAQIEICIPATQRPAPCDARRAVPTFLIERSANALGKGTRQRLVRRAPTRIYFGRGMYSSGEGERIALVLWPPNYFDQKESDLLDGIVCSEDRIMTLSSFEDGDLGPGGAFISRWGGDPIRYDTSPQEHFFIPPSAFEDLKRLGEGPHRPGYVTKARMPTQAPTSTQQTQASKEVLNEDSYLDVSLLSYEPCFDLDREEWYVDVDLRPSLATDPFVRLGLVRYQEYAISPNLRVSKPVTLWTQLLPTREVELCCESARASALSITTVVKGQASSGVKPLQRAGIIDPTKPDAVAEAEKAWTRLQKPKMTLALVHEAPDENGVLQRTPINPDPRQKTLAVEPAYERDSLMHWSLSTMIDVRRMRELGKGLYVAYLEEIEERMPATYPNEPIAPATMFDGDTFQKSGPRFSARIPFYEERATPE